jgi:hypothetical protein
VCSTGGSGGYRTWDQELEAEEVMEEVLVEDSSTRTSSKGAATAGEMEAMMDLKSPAETTTAAAAAAAVVAAEDSPEDEEGELQEQQEQEVVAADSQHQQHQHQSCMDQSSNGLLMQSYNENEDEDDEEIERSRHFAQALKELKSLRPQLYSAAEYCESSYLYSDQKQV